MVRFTFTACVCAAMLLAGCAALESGSAQPGVGELCVATGSAAPQCGPVEVSRFEGRIKLRVADMVYDLKLEEGQLDLMLIQGTTLVDRFSAPYSWNEQMLRFVDVDRQVFYQLRFAH